VPLRAASPDEDRDGVTPADAPRRRRCLVTRDVLPIERLVRFAVAPDGLIVPDIAGRLPGRGLWLSARRDIVRRACSGEFFAKAARRPVRSTPDLADHVERLLRRSCLDLIGLARRAGQAVAGFERTREWLQAGRAGVLLRGADAAADGREKLERLGAGLATVTVLSSDELGSAFGRERIVHAALGRGALAGRLVREAARLAGFRSAPD
jgi:hypothetical protein